MRRLIEEYRGPWLQLEKQHKSQEQKWQQSAQCLPVLREFSGRFDRTSPELKGYISPAEAASSGAKFFSGGEV